MECRLILQSTSPNKYYAVDIWEDWLYQHVGHVAEDWDWQVNEDYTAIELWFRCCEDALFFELSGLAEHYVCQRKFNN